MYENNFRSWIKHLDFMILDIIAITIAYWTAFGVRKRINWLSWESNYRGFYMLVIAIDLILVFLFRTYSNVIRRGYLEEIWEILKHNALLLGAMLAYLVFSKQSTFYSRLFLGYFAILSVFLMCMARLLWKKFIRSRMSVKDKRSAMLIITERRLASFCIHRLKSISYQPFQVCGIILVDEDAKISRETIAGAPVLGTREDMMEYIRLNVVDQVLIHLEDVNEETSHLVRLLVDMGIVVHISLNQFAWMPHQQISTLGELSVITTCFRTAGTIELFLKRCMDVAGAVVGLIITAVAFIFIAPVIYIKSPGPVFFSQERVGKNGRRFQIYKFRSMYLDAEERKKELMEQNKMQGLMFKMDDDPRIIKGIGHFIRQTSIDELPQFWNILKGDMSLVGTRPPTVDEFEQYAYHHKVRLSFRPGLTGMWQVSGRSDITDFEEVVRLDEKYIANWNLALDIRILIKTIQVVLLRKGSE